MDITCPELEVITSDYGSRDTSAEEPNFDGFCGIESYLDSEGNSWPYFWSGPTSGNVFFFLSFSPYPPL